jgi:hypothetical protein
MGDNYTYQYIPILSSAMSTPIIGSTALNHTQITADDSPYTVLTTDDFVTCDTSTGNITVNLPTTTGGIRGTHLWIQNEGTTGNDVTIVPGTNELFSSTGNFTLSDNYVADLTFTSTGQYATSGNWNGGVYSKEIFWQRVGTELLPYTSGDGLGGIEYIKLNTSPSVTHTEGQLHWNDDDKTLNLDTEVTDTTIQVGQEIVVRATNKTGGTLSNGTIVYVDGAQGNRPTIDYANAGAVATADATIGMVTADISNNNTGYITTFGLVRGVDTAAYAAGTTLYLSTTSGEYTSTGATPPNHSVRIGYVITQDAVSGVVFITIDTGNDLDNLHDVILSSVATNDVIQHDGTTWVNKQDLDISDTTDSSSVSTGSIVTAGGVGIAKKLYALKGKFGNSAPAADRYLNVAGTDAVMAEFETNQATIYVGFKDNSTWNYIYSNGNAIGFTNQSGNIAFTSDTNSKDARVYGNLYIGNGVAATDYQLIFDGETNDGILTWMEDEDYFDIQDDVVFTNDSGLAHGEIYAYESGTTLTITGSGIANKVQVTVFDTNGSSINSTPDHTNDHITVDVAGKYLVTVSMSFESAGGTEYVLSGGVWTNNGATQFQNVHMSRSLSGGGGDTGSSSMSGICDFAVNDTVEVWVWNETNTNNVVIDDVTLSMVQIAGT